MNTLILLPDFSLIILASSIALVAGIVKGVIGFVFPLIMLSGLGILFPPDQAIAYMILPLLITNVIQALRHGIGPALAAFRQHLLLIVPLAICLFFAAHLVVILTPAVLYFILGSLIISIAVMQLAGIQLTVSARNKNTTTFLVGCGSGILGGVAGVWSPFIIAYLTTLNLTKRDYIIVLGVIYSFGAAMLTVSHTYTGLFTTESAAFSALLIIPAIIGWFVGAMVQDRLNQQLFRKITLVVLSLTGLNLILRAII